MAGGIDAENVVAVESGDDMHGKRACPVGIFLHFQGNSAIGRNEFAPAHFLHLDKNPVVDPFLDSLIRQSVYFKIFGVASAGNIVVNGADGDAVSQDNALVKEPFVFLFLLVAAARQAAQKQGAGGEQADEFTYGLRHSRFPPLISRLPRSGTTR